MAAPKVTLPDVAREAGVSLSSASRALHGSGASPSMIDKVTRAAQRLGYSVDERGRLLRSNRTFQIAFAVADIGNPVYVEMLTAIQEVAAPEGFRIVVASMGDTGESAVETIQSFRHGLVDGIIVSPLRITQELLRELEDTTVPTVVIGRSLQLDFVDSISTNSSAGIELAVDHLASRGCRRLAFLNGPADTTPGEARNRGFSSALARNPGLTSEVWQADDFTVAAGVESASHALRGRTTPLDGVIAANDLLAIGAMKALHHHGIRVPEDVLVTGMDDTEFGRVFQPSLTSVSLNAALRGKLAATRLLQRINNPGERATNTVIPPTLAERQSTMPASGSSTHTTKELP